jgi:hypothetical protein
MLVHLILTAFYYVLRCEITNRHDSVGCGAAVPGVSPKPRNDSAFQFFEQ